MTTDKKSYTILMTGAGGFLGFHIAKLLIEAGHQVTNFSRSHHSKLNQLNIKTIQGNLSSLSDIENIFKEHIFDTVIHVAAKVGMWGRFNDFYDVNVLGTENLIKMSKSNNIKRFIFTSSPSVIFGKENLKGVDESQPYPDSYLNFYAETKAMAEKIVINANCDTFFTAALRPHLIYGEDDPNLIPRLIQARKQGRLKQVGSGENLVDVIYVKNAAKAHLQILEKIDHSESIQGQCYFIGQEKPVNLWHFINKLLIAHDQPVVNKNVSFKTAYLIGALIEFALKLANSYKIDPPMTRFMACQLAKDHYFSHNKAIKDFSYEPEISIDKSFDFF
jgi:2-alkyl-3-oxoalkanoate reductase